MNMSNAKTNQGQQMTSSATRAYVDAYSDEDLAGMSPAVAANFRAYAAKLKSKRSNPPRNWTTILSTLAAGGRLSTPMYGKTYWLYSPNNGRKVATIRAKTIEEMVDAGLLEWGSDDCAGVRAS